MIYESTTVLKLQVLKVLNLVEKYHCYSKSKCYGFQVQYRKKYCKYRTLFKRKYKTKYFNIEYFIFIVAEIH